MAAKPTSAASRVPPPANGQLTTTVPSSSVSVNGDNADSNSTKATSSGNVVNENNISSNNNNNNSSENSNSKGAPSSGQPAKKPDKECGDQISCSVTEPQGKDCQNDNRNNKNSNDSLNNKNNDNNANNDNDTTANDENNSSNDNNNNNNNSSNLPEQQQRVTRKGGLSQELRERIKKTYHARTVNLLVRYNKLGSQFADFANNVAFLSRCANMAMVPKLHRVYNSNVRNTRTVVRILDQCCYKILMADLDQNRRRKYQVRKNRERVQARLREIMSPEDFEEIQKICEENKEQHFNEVKEKQRKEFEELMDEYKNNEASRGAKNTA